jgi:glutamate formiminotransferase / 5-formyltetrahydrofolate cyclo-ligase
VPHLIESVPNFSEGTRLDVVDAIAAAIAAVPGAHLFDRTSDASHDRSVLTLAGDADAVQAALEAAIAVAIERIDMNAQHGEHPRIGAVDVVPFVPLGDTTMADAVALARAFGARVAEHFDLPVYLYAEAATRPDRVRLADVRRGEYEGLREAILTDPDRAPDFGPARLHPTAGAVAVGARPFLVAWNINLATTDLDLAKSIAAHVRESSGGLPKVQGRGFRLEDPDCAQVSMNLLDVGVTPMWRVYEAVRDEAAAAGVDVLESELIGLAPLRAFTDVADHAGVPADLPVEERLRAAGAWMRLRGADPSMALELRVAAAMAAEDAGGPRAAMDPGLSPAGGGPR